MREIKFRVFGKENKIMYDWEELLQMDSFKDHMKFSSENRSYSSLMQYTGLTDKNGVEIYEGDIITGTRESHWHGGYDLVKGKVYFAESTSRYAVDGIGSGNLNDIDNVGVKGNIYEHPHLLEVE